MLAGSARCVVAVGTAWLLAGSGCSLIFVKGPPREHRRLDAFDCTRDVVSPIVDTMEGVVLAGWFLAASLKLSDGAKNHRTLYFLSLPLLAVPVGSAAYGFRTVGKCHSADAELTGRMSRIRPARRAVPTATEEAPAGAPQPPVPAAITVPGTAASPPPQGVGGDRPDGGAPEALPH